MKSIWSAIHLLNRNHLKESVLCHKRFYCNANSNNTTNAEINKNLSISKQPNDTSVQTEKSDRLFDKPSGIDSDLAAGITITSYNTFGFRLNSHIQVIGPIILFPRAVFSWNIESAEKINHDSMMIFGLIQPKVDTLIIGIGEKADARVSTTILQFAHNHKLNVEILTTELACTQYNFLQSESRMVAAALVPPRGQTWRDDDIFQTLNFDNKLFTIENMHLPDIRDLRKSKKPKS